MRNWSSAQRKKFAQRLINWFSTNQRQLPWRATSDPYAIWISEVMLQQTQVATVIPYFKRFLKKFPTVKSLANAKLDDVLKRWEGLGYYSRARNLHRAAKIVVDDYSGRLPGRYKEWLALPGIGKYTAAAISSIAFDEDRAVLDGNVRRVLARLLCLQTDPKSPKVERSLEKFLDQTLPRGKASDFNQGLMELGALICTPQKPQCTICPVEGLCKAKRSGLQNELPIKRPKAKRPHHHVAVGVIWKSDKLLITQRHVKGLLGGLWEFPGGKKNADESLETCLHRELQEELAIKVSIIRPLEQVRYEYTHFRVTLYPFECTWKSGRPKALGCADWAWVTPNELKKYAFPTANHKIFKVLFAPGA